MINNNNSFKGDSVLFFENKIDKFCSPKEQLDVSIRFIALQPENIVLLSNNVSIDKDKKRIKILTLSLAITLLTILSMGAAHAALSTKTAHTIQGTAPYLVLNGIKATDTSSLLSIKIGEDEYVSDAAGNMRKVGESASFTSPITLPVDGYTFSNVATIVPADSTSYALDNTSVIPTSARRDDDGDGNFSITGNIQGIWTDKNNNSITNLSDVFNLCNAPYTLTLSTTGSPSITSQYGEPNSTAFNNATAKFVINPHDQPRICFAKPELEYGTGQYAGPESMWNSTKGFLTQSVSPSSYNANFPTTGASGFYFDLDVAGANSALTWNPVTVGGITATMSNITSTSVRVTLTGPTVTRTSKTVETPTLPATFELVGTDGVVSVKYGFVIKKWFISRGARLSSADVADQWCASLGYVTAGFADLTNSNYSLGALVPSQEESPDNFAQRKIGAGLIPEWGNVTKYNNYADSSESWNQGLNQLWVAEWKEYYYHVRWIVVIDKGWASSANQARYQERVACVAK